MNIRVLMLSMVLLFSAVALGRTEDVLSKPVPSAYVGYITVSALARYAPLEHRSALALLYYGKYKQAEAELRRILQKKPEAKDVYVGLVQVSPYFREQEWKRLQAISSSADRLSQFKKAVLLHYRAMAASPLPAFGTSRAPEEVLRQRREAAHILQKLWNEQKETIVGAVLLEVKDFISDSEHEAMALELIRHLAGEGAWKEYQQAKSNGWSSSPPKNLPKSIEKLRALSAATADRWSFLQRKYRKPSAVELKEVAYLERWRRAINKALPN